MWSEDEKGREKKREEKKNYNNGSFTTYRNCITKVVFTLGTTQYTANVELGRIIVISRRRFLHDGKFYMQKNDKM